MSSSHHLTSPLASKLDIGPFDQTGSESFNTSLTTRMGSSDMNTWSYLLYGYWNDEGSVLIKDYPLLESGPIPIVIIMSTYFIFVTVVGPWIMSKRQAFELRGPMLAYNSLMVVFNVYFFFKFVSFCDFGREFMKFEFPSKFDQSSRSKVIADVMYYYFLTKFVDLLDTIFFVLRKKNRQISGLHLYHHTSVPLLGYSAMKLAPTLPGFQLFGMLNSLVHTIMYSYYALSALGASIQPYLWWKKYITQIQLAQFVILIIYAVVLTFFQTGYPQIWLMLALPQPAFFFYMFFDFYLKSYRRKAALSKAQ